MPFCPECFTEYVEGTTDCEDCAVPLLPGSPPEVEDLQQTAEASEAAPAANVKDVKMVRVRTFSGPTALLEADLARNLLQQKRIPSLLPGEISAELLPGLDVPLLVREQDAERAARVLAEYFDSPGPIAVP